MLELPPLSLYVHVPWCVRKCPYCDFNSHEAPRGNLPEQEYLDALLADLYDDLPYVQGRKLQSIFIGGGTPSLLSAEFYGQLLNQVERMVGFGEGLECTLEANPGTVEAQRFGDFRSAGINRLSLGIQSFNDSFLATLGRIHDGSQAVAAIDICRQAGFDNFNLDIMYALPDQDPAQALADLEQALDFAPTHLSWYQLTLEPNTAFYSSPPRLPDEDTVVAIMDQGLAALQRAGLHRYETSAYARPGRQSIHNRNYWEFGDYIGIGAGASGKVTLSMENRLIRTRKVRQPDHYLSRSGSYVATSDTIAADSLDLEFMMNALRLLDGFDRQLYEARTGRSFSDIQKELESLELSGFLQILDSRIRPTSRGVLFTNSVLEHFL